MEEPDRYLVYLQKTLEVTEAFARRQIDRQLTIEGICRNLGTLAGALYTISILGVLPATCYELREQGGASARSEERTSTHSSFGTTNSFSSAFTAEKR